MKRHLASCLVLLLLTTANVGCFVLDELDAGKKEMSRYSKTKPKEDPAKVEQKGAPGQVDIQAYQEQQKKWWAEARSLDPKDIDDSIVRCKLGGKSQFMGRNECLARGGKPSDASG